jgi:hypothetical protein
MGLLDKAKASAAQAAAKAQQGMAQGQAKLDTMQARKQADALLRDLGAAYFTEQRHAGPATAVSAALTRVEEHEAAHGPVDTAATAPVLPVQPGAAGPAGTGPGGAGPGGAGPGGAGSDGAVPGGAGPVGSVPPGAPGAAQPGASYGLDDL